jgi:hypothetical protein
VVVNNLDVFGIGARPSETNSELVIHLNAALAGAVALYTLELVRGWCSQIRDAPGQVELFELAQRRALDIHESGNAPQPE